VGFQNSAVGAELGIWSQDQASFWYTTGSPEVKDVRIAGIAGLGQEAGGGPRVASARQVGRIQVVKAGNRGEGFHGLRIRVAG